MHNVHGSDFVYLLLASKIGHDRLSFRPQAQIRAHPLYTLRVPAGSMAAGLSNTTDTQASPRRIMTLRLDLITDSETTMCRLNVGIFGSFSNSTVSLW